MNELEFLNLISNPQNQAIQSAAILLSITAISAVLALIPAIFVAIAQGNIGAKATEAVGRNPEASKEITSTMIVSCAIAETSGIYGLLIALILIFVNPLFNLFISLL
ncbi:MAG: ATP synthase F0 subunit C [Defluviitaleaceae bacterium]|nr:ATP synthase F0 subunit C [Defluviitaleaceae bacterium]